MRGYPVTPTAASGKIPAAPAIHENRGLTPCIHDVARRAAKAGLLAFAPDGLTPLGGHPGNDDEGRILQRTVDGAKLMNDFSPAAEWLTAHEASTGKVGAAGFRHGGGVCGTLAAACPEPGASGPFHGRQPNAADVPKVEAPRQTHHAELAPRINEGALAYARLRWTLRARPPPPASTRASTTGSTTTAPRGMTKRRRGWRGRVPPRSSMPTGAEAR
jgi:carboxymethylenebutenolidase